MTRCGWGVKRSQSGAKQETLGGDDVPSTIGGLSAWWPMVIASQLCPQLTMAQAWLMARHVAESAVVSALSRASGRPTASSLRGMGLERARSQRAAEHWKLLGGGGCSTRRPSWSRVTLPGGTHEPRTTRCVCRWTRWSSGLAEATEMLAMEYESAKSLLTYASHAWATHGTSPMRTERPATRWRSGPVKDGREPVSRLQEQR